MKDYLTLGPVPANENCVQVDKEQIGYWDKMYRECLVYKHQLQRMFPDVKFTIKSYEHDFGRYCEAAVVYDDCIEEEESIAFDVESNSPLVWDDEAKKELKDIN